jgi:hypothetical protein
LRASRRKHFAFTSQPDRLLARRMKATAFMKSRTGKRRSRPSRLGLDPKSITIAVLALLLWTTNRRRSKPDFQTSGRRGVKEMIPSMIGITEGAIDRGNRVEIIQNGHFFDRLLDDIAAAKQSIHIDVQILLPAAGVIDLPSVQHASHHHYGVLLEAGVRIFEYQPTLIHQKVMIVDGIWSCVGSTNFDDRSFDLNDEITVGFTDPDIAQQLRGSYFEDLKRAREINLAEWNARPWTHKLLDASLFLGRREL